VSIYLSLLQSVTRFKSFWINYLSTWMFISILMIKFLIYFHERKLFTKLLKQYNLV